MAEINYSSLPAIGDFVFEDLDADGIQDSNEPGLENVTVKLIDLHGNVVDTTITDQNGEYIFDDLHPGEYQVMFNNPDEAVYMFSPRQADGDPHSGINSDGPMSDVFSLHEDEFNHTIDAGLFRKAKLGDFVFEDLDQDGIQDNNEPGIAGVTVKLQDPNGQTLETTTTDGSGMYMFSGLTPGDYKVMFNNPDSNQFEFSPRQVGNDPTIDSDGAMSDVVTLVSGENNNTIDAGLFKTAPQVAKLGDFVFEDLNADGIQQGNEPGLSGVQVVLLDGQGNFEGTTPTDSNGMYMFGDLDPGDYKVMFLAPNGFMFSPRQVGNNPAIDSDGSMSDVVTLAAGEFNDTIDAGLFQKAKLGDFVFNDENQNGIQDTGESGISGAQVKLQDPNGQTLATTTTDGSGMYMFSGLTPGDYKVMFTQPTGFDGISPFQAGNNPAVDSDADPNNGLMSDVISLSSGENNNTIDAGFFKPIEPAKLGDFVFQDLDQDGIQDSNEPGIAGAQVKLQDSSGQTLATTTTDGSGMYMFSGLTPGDYKVMFTQPSGFDSVSPFQVGNNPAVDSDADPNNGLMSDVVSLSPGEFNSSIDAGFFNAPPPTAGLGDFVFEDLDADGIQDANEPGISGVEVKLQDPSGTTLNTTITDGSGMYMFSGLTPGDYKVMFTQPSGFDAVSPFQAGNNPAVDSDANPSNGLMSDVVTLAGGEFNETIDAGFYKFAKLGDFVFEDLDKDGIQDSNEPGIAGAQVKLQDPSGQTLATTTTDGNGMYMFSGLTPSDYKVMFTQPTGFDSVSPFQVGNNPAVDSDADPNNGLMSDVISLSSGENNNTIDAGFFQDVDAEIDIEKYVKTKDSFWDFWKADFKDADTAPGPDALTGTVVEFKYVVTNPGETPLSHVKVTDDKLFPKAKKTWWGYNVGDDNKDKLLNPGEKWIFTASEFAQKGLQTNIGTATGTPVDHKGNPIGLPDVMDSDPANYTGIESHHGDFFGFF